MNNGPPTNKIFKMSKSLEGLLVIVSINVIGWFIWKIN